jgi:hypothetical protein
MKEEMRSESNASLERSNQALDEAANALKKQSRNDDTLGFFDIAADGVRRSIDEPLEKQLSALGYTSLARIFVETPDLSNTAQGVEVARESRYIKAIDRNGNLVYIETNVDGYVIASPDEVTLYEGTSGLMIPRASKIGALQCASLDTCGVAYECADGICVVTRNDNMEPKEVSLVRKRDIKPDEIYEEGSPIPYPVVRFSDIIASPDHVSAGIAEAVLRLRNLAEARCQRELNLFLDSSEGISNTADQLVIETVT